MTVKGVSIAVMFLCALKLIPTSFAASNTCLRTEETMEHNRHTGTCSLPHGVQSRRNGTIKFCAAAAFSNFESGHNFSG